MKIFSVLFLSFFFSVANAEITFPLTPEQLQSQWRVIDMDDSCSVVGPAFRVFPTVDGSDPGWPEQFAYLEVATLDGASLPDYDGNLRQLALSFISCGPRVDDDVATPYDESLCYNAATVHEDGTGCAGTDTLQQIAILSDKNVDQRLEALFSTSSVALTSAFNNAKLITSQVFGAALNAMLVNSESLPTNVDGVNLQYVWTAIFGTNGDVAALPEIYQSAFASLRTPAQQTLLRVAALAKKVLDAEACRLDPSDTAACTNAIQDGEIGDPLGWPTPAGQ